jgi:methylated-DNA-[protein]-cysteine S-methyltransferase
MEKLWYTRWVSPVGALLIAVSEKGLVALEFERQDRTIPANWVELREKTAPYVRELEEYFASTRHQFDLPLDMRGTEFQKRCWQELLKIPYGETRSYGDIARAMGNPKAVRAVGLANARNPIAIIVPCHRVIGADGSLTGYGGGLWRKRQLLELEKIPTSKVQSPMSREGKESAGAVLRGSRPEAWSLKPEV